MCQALLALHCMQGQNDVGWVGVKRLETGTGDC